MTNTSSVAADRRISETDAQVSWLVELRIKNGQRENFLILTRAMVEQARNENGVLSYQRFISDDGQTIHVHERYVNSDAALAHLRAFARFFADQFASMVERTRFTVFGHPSDELRFALDSFGATSYLAPFGDLPYWAWHNASASGALSGGAKDIPPATPFRPTNLGWSWLYSDWSVMPLCRHK
jgi:quinol monooxygenase YgiN